MGYDWNYTNPLAEVSDDDNDIYTVEGTSQNGQGTVSLTVTTPSGATATASRKIWVGYPEPEEIDYINIGPNYPNSFVLCDDMPNDGKVKWDAAGSILEYSWSVYDDAVNYWQVNQHQNEPFPDVPMKDVQFSKPYGSVNGWVNVIVKAKNTCGWGQYKLPALQFSTSSCGGMYLIMSPNPTSGITEITIASSSGEVILKSASTETTFDETTEWELEVYSPSQTLKEKKTKLKGNSTKIQTQGWQEGVYVVRVKYKDEILAGKLVVKQ